MLSFLYKFYILEKHFWIVFFCNFRIHTFALEFFLKHHSLIWFTNLTFSVSNGLVSMKVNWLARDKVWSTYFLQPTLTLHCSTTPSIMRTTWIKFSMWCVWNYRKGMQAMYIYIYECLKLNRSQLVLDIRHFLC